MFNQLIQHTIIVPIDYLQILAIVFPSVFFVFWHILHLQHKFVTLFFCCFLNLLLSHNIFAAMKDLSDLEKKIIEEYPFTQIKADELFRSLRTSRKKDYLVFDVREREEYLISHIEGAIQINPGITPSQFIQQFDERVKNKHIVFYCSVGYRSSILLKKLSEMLLKQGANSFSNLQGGLFRWHNNGFPLVNDTGNAEKVHPYDEFWGQYLDK